MAAAGAPIDDLLTVLAARSPVELHDVQTRMGGVLHAELVHRAGRGFGGLVISDAPCPGLGDAFTSFDGSSDYVRGYLTPVAPAAIEVLVTVAAAADPTSVAFADSLGDGVRRFLDAHSLPGELYLGVTGASDLTARPDVRILIDDRSGRVGELVALPRPSEVADADEELAVLHHLAHVAALVALARWLDRTGSGGIERRIAACVAEPATPIAVTDRRLLGDVADLANAARGVWESLRAGLEPGTHISAGESFTFGRVARLLCSQPGADRFVDYLYGWYDPAYKGAIGVPAEQLTDERIAEPRTVELASLGLLRHAPGLTTMCVATSGWANNDWLPDGEDGARDFFSVALAARDGADPDLVDVETLRYSVLATADAPIGPGRRQLTRQLGVAAAVLLLARRVASPGGAVELLDRLERFGGPPRIAATTHRLESS